MPLPEIRKRLSSPASFLLVGLFTLAPLLAVAEPPQAQPPLSPVSDAKAPSPGDPLPPPKASGTVRIATFNVALAGEHAGQIRGRLQGGNDAQGRAIAEILQLVDADIVLLNELDYDASRETLELFLNQYLAVPQDNCAVAEAKCRALSYPHYFLSPVNTGLASGFDLDRDGTLMAEVNSNEYARDAWGYGQYPGQYGMALFSKYPIDRDAARTFQHFLWKDMPGALLPEDPENAGDGWYSAAILEKFPLSSKSHWDVPVRIDGETLHVLCSHPTPPVFDGPEDRNGKRNHDEIRFWADYIDPARSDYIVDDRGGKGGLEGRWFAILGDLNSDPHDGTDERYPIRQLLNHPRLDSSFVPKSAGALEQASLQGGANARHQGDPAADTGDFGDKNGPGNLRLDYVLPAKEMTVVGGGVFWPATANKRFALVGNGFPAVSSDHRLVWIDVNLPSQESATHAE